MRFLVKLPLLLGTTLALSAVHAMPAMAQSKGHLTGPVHPGQAIGPVKLGEKRTAVLRTLGKPDQHYTLPNGVSGDKFANGATRIYYRQNKVVQISVQNPTGPLPGGVTLQSSPDEVDSAYPGLKRHPYRAVGGRTMVYMDSTVHGLAFEFARPKQPNAGDTGGPTLYAVIVHLGGPNVIPDAGEATAKAAAAGDGGDAGGKG